MSRPIYRPVVLIILVAIHFGILFPRMNSRFPTVDEVAHLPAGISHLSFRQFGLYRVNPPLTRIICCLPAWFTGVEFDWRKADLSVGQRPEFSVGVQKLVEDGVKLNSIFVMPQILGCLISMFCLAIFYFWMREVLGECVAFVASCMYVSAPCILAFAPSIVPDVGSVAFGMLACQMAWRYAMQTNIERAFIAGLTVGLAMLCKLTWILSPIVVPVIVFVNLKLLGNQFYRNCNSKLFDFAIFLAATLLVLNAGYLFEDVFVPLGHYTFCSEALGGSEASVSSLGNRFDGTILANVPVPLPRNYLLGIDYLKMEVEHKMWSFLMGEWKFGSWPHYYIMTTLFKTPEPTLLGAVIGLGVLIAGIRRRMVEPKVISMFLFLIIPAAVCFASVSLQGGFNHHHRYVLMIYPPMFALAAYIASPVGQKLLRVRLPFGKKRLWSFAVPLAVTLAVLSAASSLRVHPYYTSYFNTLSGGPENGWRLLGFSNIDWGQDILEVDRWLKAHPDRRPLVMDIDYFGMNGDLFDVPTSQPPHLPKGASIDEVRRSITETQWWIISVKRLYNLPDHPGLEYLQQIEPVERIAYAYHVYRMDPLPERPVGDETGR